MSQGGVVFVVLAVCGLSFRLVSCSGCWSLMVACSDSNYFRFLRFGMFGVWRFSSFLSGCFPFFERISNRVFCVLVGSSCWCVCSVFGFADVWWYRFLVAEVVSTMFLGVLKGVLKLAPLLAVVHWCFVLCRLRWLARAAFTMAPKDSAFWKFAEEIDVLLQDPIIIEDKQPEEGVASCNNFVQHDVAFAAFLATQDLGKLLASDIAKPRVKLTNGKVKRLHWNEVLADNDVGLLPSQGRQVKFEEIEGAIRTYINTKKDKSLPSGADYCWYTCRKCGQPEAMLNLREIPVFCKVQSCKGPCVKCCFAGGHLQQPSAKGKSSAAKISEARLLHPQRQPQRRIQFHAPFVLRCRRSCQRLRKHICNRIVLTQRGLLMNPGKSTTAHSAKDITHMCSSSGLLCTCVKI